MFKYPVRQALIMFKYTRDWRLVLYSFSPVLVQRLLRVIHAFRMRQRFLYYRRKPRYNRFRIKGCWDCPERAYRRYGACLGCPRLSHWTDWFIEWPE